MEKKVVKIQKIVVKNGKMEEKWRKKVVALVAEKNPETILDIATGTGDLVIMMSNTSAKKIIGLDISAGMLEVGKQKIEAKKTYLLRLSSAKELNNLYFVFSKDTFLLPYKVNKLSKKARRNKNITD